MKPCKIFVTQDTELCLKACIFNSFIPNRLIPLFQIFATPNVLKTECAQRVNSRDLHIDAAEQIGLDVTVVKL